MKNYCQLIQPVGTLAREAGQRIMDVYVTEFEVEQKHDHSPVTDADMAAHDLIIEELASLTPDLPIISEEDKPPPFEIRKTWERYWLVDPLDGTREFVKRNGEFTVNIALIENHQPVLGVIYAPVMDTCYGGCRGEGAFRKKGTGPSEPISVRGSAGSPIIVAGSRSHRSDRLQKYLDKLESYKVIGMGSSLKSCLVAEGSADIYVRLGPTSEWDTAAAQCIVEEAGGRITDTSMQPLRYNTKESLLNPHFFAFGDLNTDWSAYLPED